MKEAKTGLRNPVFEEFSWKILQKKKTVREIAAAIFQNVWKNRVQMAEKRPRKHRIAELRI